MNLARIQACKARAVDSSSIEWKSADTLHALKFVNMTPGPTFQFEGETSGAESRRYFKRLTEKQDKQGDNR